MATMPEGLGVVEQHEWRSQNDPAYRDVHLAAPSTKRHHNSQEHTDGATAGGDQVDQLTGDDLEAAVRDANIEGRSTMTADEKRQARRDQA